MLKRFFFFIILLFPLVTQAQEKSTQIAFVSDIHLLDIYADYANFDGVPVPGTNKKAKIRTMNAQLHSTRLFNENYFALRAVLDDIGKRGVKLVALPGDYTDDGQPLNLKGLSKILKEYQEKYSISFFITTGNHDPVQPFNMPGGKNDFLGENGKNQPIYSKIGLYTPKSGVNDVIIESALEHAGYETILKTLSNFGFNPQASYLYWETPFSKYTYENYSFKKAMKAGRLKARMYQLNDTLKIPDASYLVEPVDGVWLLAIDGNTYIPQQNGGLSDAGKGYNDAIDYKKHLFSWIKNLALKAKKYNKQLIAFSHYPAIDFNEDASSELKDLLGENKWQLERVPEERIAKTLAHAGVKIHFAGHMHINDTGERDYGDGYFLVNIQTPSLAAYIPGYKLLTLVEGTAEVETVTIDEVPNFKQLFPLYEQEYKYLESVGKPVWDRKILDSKNYHDFAERHLESLIKLRFIPNDWPGDFYAFLSNLNGKYLLLLANYKDDLSPEEFLKDKKAISAVKEETSGDLNAYAKWNADQMIADFYKLRNADKLAFRDIPSQRLTQYAQIIDAFLKNTTYQKTSNKNAQKLYLLMSIFNKFLNGLPADHLKIDLKTGKIDDLD
tara:strand:- start:2419 stop:4257 length:1839 start_codon:yes stop_codon:yes gene_type:complete